VPDDIVANLERLPVLLRDAVRAYAQTVQQVAGEHAEALVFYGLVIHGAVDLSTQPARNVLVLNHIDLEVLRSLGRDASRHARSGIASPVVMTPDYIARSRDTFPLELIQIQQQHVLVFGKDFFTGLSFQDAHVRMQCERELKTALLAMHEGLLATAGRERWLHEEVADVAEGLVRILRGISWLKDIREPKPVTELLSEVENAVGRKLAGIRAGLDPTQRHDWRAFQVLYDDVAALGAWVDAW
jgi:hypothetical protein